MTPALALRYIIVGLGNIGGKRVNVLGIRCRATVDPVNPVADYREVADVDPATYDAAILAVPNHVKLALMHALLAAGKHVLVEKPVLFETEASARELEAVAARTGAIWYTSYNHRFEPALVNARRMLENGQAGRVYHAQFLYGNGTVQHAGQGWRAQGFGVLEDLGCHLLDLFDFLLGHRGTEFLLWDARPIETTGCDHCVFASRDRRLVATASFAVWKNTFTADVYGEHGSVHVRGLRKWGGSEVVTRTRVRPSGVPIEQRCHDQGPDETWAADLAHFETRVAQGLTSCADDWRISQALGGLARQIPRL